MSKSRILKVERLGRKRGPGFPWLQPDLPVYSKHRRREGKRLRSRTSSLRRGSLFAECKELEALSLSSQTLQRG